MEKNYGLHIKSSTLTLNTFLDFFVQVQNIQSAADSFKKK